MGCKGCNKTLQMLHLDANDQNKQMVQHVVPDDKHPRSTRLDRSVASMGEKIWCRKISPGLLIAYLIVLGLSS